MKNQMVRPDEIGECGSLIKEAAARFGIKEADIAEFELKTQFRCSGSDAYLQWLDKVLGITDCLAVDYDARMQLKIFADPVSEMMAEIRQRNLEKNNMRGSWLGSVWPSTKPNPDGSLLFDVLELVTLLNALGVKGAQFWKWATRTVQGIGAGGHRVHGSGF